MKPYALVLSNDIQEPERMLEVTEQTAPYIDGIKIGITSSMLPGVEVFKKAKEIIGEDKVLLADYKVADIGFTNKKTGEWAGTNEKIVRNLCQAGADYITCHTITGISSIEESIATAHKHGGKVLTLPYMTHKGANAFFGMPLNGEQKEHLSTELKEYGIKPGGTRSEWLYTQLNDVDTMNDFIIILGHHFGVDGFIGPANNPDVLKQYRKFTSRPIWSPGFGRQDKQGRDLETQIKDWGSVVGPDSAMIVGSLIYKAEKPGEAAREVMETRDRVVRDLVA
jgi:orotidine-5'-phosphate decarboxylase